MLAKSLTIFIIDVIGNLNSLDNITSISTKIYKYYFSEE